MNHKWSLLGVGRFYTREEALTLLTNMSDFEDESTSESEIEGDSSDSSEYLKRGQKAAPKLVVNQDATKFALLANETATKSGEEHVASPPKVSKAKEIPKKGQKAAPKLVARKRVIPQKASALSDGGAMASDSDLDVEDYYIVEDDNESASSEYVPCVNYTNDKVYPEDERMVGLGLMKTLVPQIFIDLRDLVKTT